VILVDALQYDAPKTKTMTQLLAKLGVAEQKVLLLTDGVKPNVHLSARNLPTAHVMPFRDATMGTCSYKCTIDHCLAGLQYAIALGWYDYKTFDVQEYQHYEQLPLAFNGTWPSWNSDLDNRPW